MSAPYAAKGRLFKRQTRARKSGTLWTCCATLDGITAQEVLVMDSCDVMLAVYTLVSIVSQQRDGGLRPKSLPPCNS